MTVQPHITDPALVPIRRLVTDLVALDADLSDAADRAHEQLALVHPEFQRSALNLIHYLALRNHDIRQLQIALAELGLSSLGRSEAHVQSSLRTVIAILHTMLGETWTPPETAFAPVDLHEGKELLRRHTETLLGPAPDLRAAHIMVTASTDLATDVAQLRAMLRAGMDILRINCAHDDAAVWTQIIANLRQAEQDTGRSCRIIMDLAGPKLRTGPLQPGPQVLKWKPQRDAYGRVLEPARIWLTRDDAPTAAPEEADVVLALPGAWLDTLRLGDDIRFVDTRNAKRHLEVTARADGGVWATTRKTAYVAPETRFQREDDHHRAVCATNIPTTAGFLTLHIGDMLLLTRSLDPGAPADGGPARIGCTLPEVFDAARVGERIWFDDGTIGGIIRDVTPIALTIEITRAKDGGAKLRSEKGINLPDTDLRLSALTAKDLADLPFVAEHADMIDFSFVSSADDVRTLHDRLDEIGGERPGVVLKVETRRAFEHLPEMVLEAMREGAAGIMIARGDLAVEVGYERLAEVQEEILWLAEAAHLPVIWATQVLETLAQTGIPSRSEITDAAMGERAECVMLNKGPHIVEAIAALDSILQRMETHQDKKRSLLRRLQAWAPRTADR